MPVGLNYEQSQEKWNSSKSMNFSHLFEYRPDQGETTPVNPRAVSEVTAGKQKRPTTYLKAEAQVLPREKSEPNAGGGEADRYRSSVPLGWQPK